MIDVLLQKIADLENRLNNLEVKESHYFTGLDVIGNSYVSGTATYHGDLYTVSWSLYTSTITGFSGTPSQTVLYKKVGRLVFVIFVISGTSNATGFTFTVPFATPAFFTNARVAVQVQDNGTFPTSPGMLDINFSSDVITVYKDFNATVFTNSGTKLARGQFWYEAAS